MYRLKKLRLLVWKNFLLQRRHKWQTFFEIMSPVLFSLILILVRCLVDPVSKPAVHYPPFHPAYINISRPILGNGTSSQPKNVTIAFSPDTPLTRAVTVGALETIAYENLGALALFLSFELLPVPLGFKSAKAMEDRLIQPKAMDTILAGIQFEDSMANKTEWPEHVSFGLRFPAVMRTPMLEHPIRASWRTNLLFPLFPKPGPRFPDSPNGGKMPGYSREMFLAVQYAVSKEIIKAKAKDPSTVSDTEVFLQRLPQLAYREDDILIALERFISMIIMLCFAYTAVNTVKVIAAEKELQLKETMRIMGLPSWLHWLAWFIKQYTFLTVSIVIMVILFKIPWKKDTDGVGFAVLTFTPWSVLLLFMMLYVVATLAFCFMVSVFFNKANTAASFMGLAWFATYSVFMLLQVLYEQITFPVKMALCLISNTAMGYAFQMMVASEGTGRGLQWGDLMTPVSYQDPFLPAHVLLMLSLDTVLYMFVALYVEKVSPGAYGVPLPWYFPITRRFWLPDVRRVAAENVTNNNAEYADALLKVVHEEEPEGVVGVNIHNLTKVYKGNKKAVDNLNLRMYQNEITILLGHNGAGKTTTISMLTGMISPTSGSATIDGYDIVKETEAARMSLGLCPQHNVLFPDLTVAEHIQFYSMLKGVPEHKIPHEIEHFVLLLELVEKRDVQSQYLSGGQQRRLSVGAAMCGSSRVVLLDEPTSGLDPAARRALWDLLQREKKGRTIILSTHFMDEADILGDRVAIMSGGRLQCVGSPYFLKKHYGVGYKLTIVKMAACNVEGCLELLRKYVPDVKDNTDIGTELTYILPSEAVSRFHELLRELDERSGSLGVASYGLSVTTLEEVFMKAGAEDFAEGYKMKGDSAVHYRATASKRNSGISISSHNSVGTVQIANDTGENGPIDKVKGFRLLRNHIKAMFLKLAYTAMRNRLQNTIQLLTPILNVLITVHIVRSWEFIRELPPLELSLKSGFDYTQTLLSRSANLTPTDVLAKAMYAYREYFRKAPDPNMVLIDLETTNLSEYYRNLTLSNLARVKYDTLVGATFAPHHVVGWFSNYGYHDSAISLALVNNALLAAHAPSSSLSVYNHPLPYTFHDQIAIMATGGSIGFQFAFNMGFCMAFVTAFIVLFSIKERSSGAKLLQRASGVRPAVLWGCSLVWDWLWLMFVVLFIIVTLAVFQEQTLATFSELGRVLLVFMVFALATVPVHYLASFCFEAAATGFSKMCFINIFTGVMPFLVTEILKLPDLGSPYFGKLFDWLFSVLPAYCLSRSLKQLSMASFALQACEGMCKQYLTASECTRRTICERYQISLCCIEDNPYFNLEEPGIGRYLVTMALVGVVAFTFLMLKEYELLNKIFYLEKRQPPVPDATEEDTDVLLERQLVQTFTRRELGEHSLVCRDLSKYYEQLLAVQRLSFAVKKAECFGLLGVNGAGKTTTFKMLTGDVRISSGDAWVLGRSIKTNIEDVHRNIGYCPQFDGLFDNLTGRETLRIYCLLRGIPIDIGTAIAEDLTQKLGLTRHLDKKVYQYSGGSKRKLSTALALLGDAPLIFLDEPTTGMDPASKRRVWACVAGAVRAGRSAVLTSHSMEECEALCSRLTIMAGGRMHCLGPLQHLKSKFSTGYTLIVKCSSGPDRDSNMNAVHEYVMANFTNSKLIESYLGISTYYVSEGGADGSAVSWWRMFELMEAARARLRIEDYSVSQTSLEQVFMHFSRLHAARDVWSMALAVFLCR